MTHHRLGGLVIGGTDPERLAAWYRAAFLPGTPAGTVLELPTGRFIFEQRDDVAATPVEPGRILINIYVDDIEATAAHLDTLGVRWIRKIEPIPPGRLATLTDADGNYVQIFQAAE